MKKLTLILFVALCSILLADGTPAQGTGTEQDPYLIETLDNLLWLSTTPEVWGNENEQFYFKQTADIDASATQNWNDGLGFSPIGNRSNCFYGNYDGNYKIISNLYINRPEQRYSGMFSRAIKSTITNLGIENCNITGGGDTGSLAGSSIASSIINCYATGNVTGAYFTGGLVGASYSSTITNCYATGNVTVNVTDIRSSTGGLVGASYSSTITNCYATGNVTGNSYTGGLVGESNSSTITNCYATGNVTSNNYYIGGFVGYANNATITNCYATGNVTGYCCAGGFVGYANNATITKCCATGFVDGEENTGGLVGYSSSSTITNCYATGNVTGNSKTGGLAGYSYGSTITNCYATGNVTSNNYYTGGFVGYAKNATITNCYATGFVDGEENTGGFIGINNEHYPSTISSSYWDIETSSQSTSAGGIGKTTAEMKEQNTYENWFWGYTWGISPEINNGYPYLLWQVNEEICFLQGEGSTENPYQISSLDCLSYLSSTPQIWDKNFLQTADIDASDTQNWNEGLGFSPIGNNSNEFYGNYDGNNKTISNLYINRPEQNYIGLFAKIGHSEIKNLGIENCIIVGGWNTAGLVASTNDSAIITNCHVTGSITGEYSTAGLISNVDYSTITSCYTACTITGQTTTSGLIGSISHSTIINCYATGNVAGTYNTAGFIGEASAYDEDNIPASTITNCYATGNVTGETRIGGFIGSTYKAKITNCYATGNVTWNGTENTTEPRIMGGFVGSICFSVITNCYSTGFVNGDEYTGGFIGFDYENYSSTITNCYYDTETSGQTTSFGGIGKTTAEMKNQSTYQNWLFGDVWAISPDVNNGYPYFVENPVNAEDETNQVTPSTNAFSFVIGPNPFNPSTNINFSLSKSQNVNIKVYNVKGQLVKTLLNKTLASGKHSINFDAKGKASGVYFINVKVNGKSNIKKALLLK